MKENKLENLAKSLYEEMRDAKTPSDVYTKLMSLAKQQPEYFMVYLGPKNIIKLSILIWSLIETHDFRLAENIFENMIFVVMMDTELEHPETECDDCGNSGRVSCDYCDGTGDEECDECDGDGNETCAFCDGVGEVSDDEGALVTCDDCDGDGTLECSNCAGEGRVRCSSCGGEGDFECQTCDGNGEVEDDSKYRYTLTYLITWSQQLNNYINSGKEPLTPIIDTSYLNEYDNDYLITYIDSDESDKINIRDYVYYAVDVDDDPELKVLGYTPRIVWDLPNGWIKKYLG